MRVMVFLHGTAIMHAAAADRTQAERVRQSSQRDPSVTKAVSAAGESYADVARRAGADVVVEDDCESIGGSAQTTAADPARSPGRTISCVIVPEFGGLAHLPDDPAQLAQSWEPRQ
jgi:hypothetical protein